MRETRYYGLFERTEDGKWVRILPNLAFRKTQAITFFQDHLLSGAFGTAPERMLKVVTVRHSYEDLG